MSSITSHEDNKRNQLEAKRRLNLPPTALKGQNRAAEFGAPGDVSIYIYLTTTGKPAAAMFSGRRIKHDWSYSFGNEDQMLKRINETVAKRLAQDEERLTQQQNLVVKIGDIYRCSWGYDQTNVDYYEVVRKTDKTVTVREIESRDTTTGDMTGRSVPCPGKFIGNELTRKIVIMGSQPYIRLSSYQVASYLEPIAIESGEAIFPESSWTSYA